MLVTSTGIVNGIIADKYGKRGTQFNKHGMPNYSLPLKIEKAPHKTCSFVIVLEDKDAYPVTGGFSWIHWLVARLTRSELAENESIGAMDFVQGCNSWRSIQGGQQSIAESSFYGGMGSPDAAHLYEMHVFALDSMPDLTNGFYMNHLYRHMEGHILDAFTLKGLYYK
jgi:Raf kinase inhibitor-like YbhB/YbcL family protein